MNRAPTAFQSEALRRAAAVSEDLEALEPAETEWINGKEESYGKLTWRFSPARIIEAYVYTDEAGVMVNGREWTVFEGPDYATQKDLLDAFISYLHDTLRSAVDMRGPAAHG